MLTGLILSPEELVAVSGGYKRPREQLEELHRQGFFRARIGKITGHVILERAHYEAICAAITQTLGESKRPRPRLQPVR